MYVGCKPKAAYKPLTLGVALCRQGPRQIAATNRVSTAPPGARRDYRRRKGLVAVARNEPGRRPSVGPGAAGRTRGAPLGRRMLLPLSGSLAAPA